MWPITANWTRLSGSQSTLAPTSSSSDGLPVTVGMMVARPGRWTPASMPSTILAVAMAAPVLPAVKKPRGGAFANHAQADAHGGVALGADRLGGLVVHADPLGSVDDVDCGLGGARPARRAQRAFERRAQNFLRANQVNAHVEVAARKDSPANLRFGGFVGTHSVYNDVDRHQEDTYRSCGLAGFLDCDHFAALVLTALLQTRWGSLRSWQLGHSEVLTGVRKSWLRRLAVRCLEWRRFGFGIAVPFQVGRHAATAARLQG